ncbi:MAG: hypothetical protein V4567_09855 [Pseudomonadota bacterium]|nr:hypothetical protein [Rhodanobacteraceae bacterium]
MTLRKRLIACLAAALLLAGCSNHNEPQHASSAAASRSAPSSQTTTDSRKAARSVVERFGKRMQEISVLAPPDAVRAELPKAYGGLLSPALLKTWQAHPDQIIGREGSSPWPDRIEVKQLDCNAGSCSVSGDVGYITSNEVAHGGVFMRRAISLELADAAHGWRITAVRLETARE